MLFIGIDLGTSSLKMILMDAQGSVRKSVSRSYPVDYPHPGWSEQAPADWLSATMEGLKELLQNEDRQAVSGISFGGQMHGLVILDEKDRVIRPAILWNDGRTKVETEYLNEVVGEEILVRETGNIAFAGFTAPKLLWLQKHEPESFARIRKIMLPKDYLAYQMTGEHATDLSDASGTLLFDVRNGHWSNFMLDLCDVKREWIPNVYKGSDPIGTLRKKLAVELDLPTTVKVMAGAGDNAAAAIATGTVESGQGNVSIGTSGTVFVASDHYLPIENHAVHQFRHTDGSFHLLGCMLSAASSHAWWQESILHQAADQDFSKDVSVKDRNDVFFLPYLIGERSPHNDENVRGAFLGLTLETTRADMSRAVLEGVSFGLRDSVEIIRELGIPLPKMTITGGGARSTLWKKKLANILNIELLSISHEEGSAYGAAMLAAVGSGVWTTVKEVSKKLVKPSVDLKPEDELVRRYERMYKRYASIYPLIRDFY